MPIQIRKSVFETNSSSSHSLALGRGDAVASPFPQHVLRGGVVEVSLGEYGWEWARYYQPANKLSYLFTQATHGTLPECGTSELLTKELLEENERLAMMAKVVKDFTGCDLRFLPSSGYIDHDSAGVGMELFKDEEGLKKFLFGSDGYIQTGNDNSVIPFIITTDRGEEYAYPEFTVMSDVDTEFLTGVRFFVADRNFTGLVTKAGAYLTEHEFNTELFAQVRKQAIALGGEYIETSAYASHSSYMERSEALPKLARGLAGLGLRMHRSLHADHGKKVVPNTYKEELTARLYMPPFLAEKISALQPTPQVMLDLVDTMRRHEHFAKAVRQAGDKPDSWAAKLEKQTSREIAKLCDQAAKEGVLF